MYICQRMKQLKKILPIILALYIIYIGSGVVIANVCCEHCETINVEHRHEGDRQAQSDCHDHHHSHECNHNSCFITVYHVDFDDCTPPISIDYTLHLLNNVAFSELIEFNCEQIASLIDYSSTAPPPIIHTPRGYLNKITALLI